jgi:ABC-2 type transport system ATP-binding protein
MGQGQTIRLENVCVSFGDRQILKGINLVFPAGETSVVIGPSGCGKSTVLRLVSGLLQPTSGRIWVGDVDITRLTRQEMKAYRQGLGFLFQAGALFDSMTVAENVAFSLTEHLRLSQDELDRIVNEKLAIVDLPGLGHLYPANLSGGMQKRVSLARAIARDPSLILYDEPTTGLDPRGRQDMWGVIEDLVKEGVTLLLTTQYLEEADQLADEIAVIDTGKVIARGTSDALKKQVGGERLEVVVESQHVARTLEIVTGVAGIKPSFDEGIRQISAPVSTGSKALLDVLKSLDEAGIHPLDIGLKRPSLDDVFLSLTGHSAEAKEEAK